VYCPVQCGAVVPALHMHINPRRMHQCSANIQTAKRCCEHQCRILHLVTCMLYIVDRGEKSVEERETAACTCSLVRCIRPASIDFIGVVPATQQCLCHVFIVRPKRRKYGRAANSVRYVARARPYSASPTHAKRSALFPFAHTTTPNRISRTPTRRVYRHVSTTPRALTSPSQLQAWVPSRDLDF
jgi:hypothetical protein